MPTASPQKAKTPRALPVQPDEQFWQRYSPHHEMPISSITSFAVHFLVVGVVGIAAYYYAQFHKDKEKPPDFNTVYLDSGGGGNVNGSGDGPGVGANGEEEALKPVDDKTPVAKVERQDLPNEKLAPLVLNDYLPGVNIGRVIDQNNAQVQAIKKMPRLDREKLFQGLVPGKGQGGPGKGGGKGTGDGPGTGTGTKAGTMTVTERVKRQMRWTMDFDTSSGRDYAEQLAGLGAIVAYRLPGEESRYVVIRDLMKKTGKEEDLSDIKLIWWTDDRRESVVALSMFLGIRPIPSRMIAFFTPEMEQYLADIELEYAKKHGKTSVDEIEETEFKSRRVGKKFVPEVVRLR